VKNEVEKDIIRKEYYKGEFYEIFPFSYQRSGFNQGKLIENIDKVKSMNGIYSYGFNSQNKIAEIIEGIELKNKFYYQFIFYDENIIKSLRFDYDEQLQNISFYSLNKYGNIEIMYGKGLRGGREEKYFYNKENILEKIAIKQFDRNGNEGNTIEHLFEYNFNGKLNKIIKQFNNGDMEIIYKE
jgi:hypothetical protein